MPEDRGGNVRCSGQPDPLGLSVLASLVAYQCSSLERLSLEKKAQAHLHCLHPLTLHLCIVEWSEYGYESTHLMIIVLRGKITCPCDGGRSGILIGPCT